MSPTGASPPHHTLQHHACFYESEEDLLATAVPFVRDGLSGGERVLVNTGRHPVTPLLQAIFADEDAAQFATDEPSPKPVSVIDHYKRLIDRGLAAGATGYRVIGHVDVETGPRPWLEWLHYEGAVNTVFAHYPMRTLCPYSTRRLAPQVATAIRQAHPWLASEAGSVRNPEYVDPADLVTRPEHVMGPDALEDGPPAIDLDMGDDPRQLPLDLYPSLLATGLGRQAVDDLVRAAGEVVANAHRHATPPVKVRLWTAPDKAVCTVTDQGPGIADPFLGYARTIGSGSPSSTSTRGGIGLWAARQLCDRLDYARTDEGFTVRLVTGPP